MDDIRSMQQREERLLAELQDTSRTRLQATNNFFAVLETRRKNNALSREITTNIRKQLSGVLADIESRMMQLHKDVMNIVEATKTRLEDEQSKSPPQLPLWR